MREKKITTLKRFRLINSLILIIFIYVFAYCIFNFPSYPTIIAGFSGFILGIEWLTLIITDKESKYYMRIRTGNLIEFVKIIIQEDRFRKDKEGDN